MLRTQCKAVPRRVPRQDCQQVPTLQVRKPSFEIPGYQNLKTDLQCTNVGKEQCQTIPRQACKSVPKYENLSFLPFQLICAINLKYEKQFYHLFYSLVLNQVCSQV